MSGRLRVDLSALQSNYQRYQRSGSGRAVAAVVKADAYGLGAAEVSRALAAVGCQCFFVATLEEGMALRQVLIEPEIFVLGGILPGTENEFVAHGLTPVINDHQQLAAWHPHRHLPIAVHVDTGMSRLGFPADVSAEDFADYRLSLLMSHFACSDEPAAELNSRQIERFRKLCQSFPGVRTSLGNSSAWLLGEGFRGDIGRPGIGLYGADPFGFAQGEQKASTISIERPEVVARFATRVLQVRDVPRGDSIGYAASFIASRDMRIAIVDCGYADGVPRALSNVGSLAFEEQLVPIVGRVSMDMTAVDISSCATEPRPGEWLECFGDRIPVDQVADWAGTISYEVLTGIRPRVPRLYHWG
jgi:alanine racemase